MITAPPLSHRGDRAAAHCVCCSGEIYRGEDYFRIDGRAVCSDCLTAFAEDYFRLCKITGGTETAQ